MTDLVREPGESIVSFAKRRANQLGYKIDIPDQKSPEPSRKLFVPKLPVGEDDPDVVPDIGPVDPYTKQAYEIDEVLGRLDIIEAYDRWCHKMVPEVGGKRENIMVSCPNPSHPDVHPDAWINLDTGDGGVGCCGPCGNLGFDKYDIAAWHFGYSVPGYKTSDFVELRQKMAEDLGYVLMVRGKDQWLVRSEPDPQITPPSDPSGTTASTSGVGSEERTDDGVTSPSPPLAVVPDFDDFPEADFVLPWRDLPIMKSGTTFLHDWMKLASKSHEPEEFYFWLGLMALGSAVGNKVTYDDSIPVRPNLMVCLVGNTGSGKSISISTLEQLIRLGLPFSNSNANGVKLISAPGSGEAFIDEFDHSVVDINDPKVKIHYPVNGLYRESELATFIKRTSRNGSTIREIAMDLYDRSHPVSSTSRGAGTATAKDHFMQMVTSTQPESVARLLSDADASAGFLNRWFFAFGSSKKRPARHAFRIDTTPCVDLLRNVKAWASQERLVVWKDQAAGEAWDSFYDNEIEPIVHREDANIVARLPLFAKKLLLLFAINDHSEEVTLAHVISLKMIWPYILKCYGIVKENVGIGTLEQCARAIEVYVEARPNDIFTFRQIEKQSGARKFSKELIKKSIEVLVWGAILDEVPRSKSDRVPRYTFMIQPPQQLASVTAIRP